MTEKEQSPHRVFKQALSQLIKEGEHFELMEERLHGRNYLLYKNAPATMKELMDAGRTHGEKEFLVYQDERVSYQVFFEKVDAAARKMHSDWNISAGDKVAIAMRNYPEWMMAFTAIVQLGAVPVPINSWGRADEVRYVLEDSGARAVFFDQARYDFFADDKDMNLPMVVVKADKKNAVPDWEQFIAGAAGNLPDYAPKLDDLALLMYTSGTTGRPKGVPSTHRQVCQAMFNFECTNMAMGITNADILMEVMKDGDDFAGVLTVPLFHISGCYAVFLMNLRSGRKTVMMHKWDVAIAAKLIEQEKIGIFSASPSMLLELFESPEFERAKTDHLFSLGGGGSAFPSTLPNLIEKKSPNRLPGCGYGMTESNASAVSMNGALFRERPKASGLASPVVRISIRDEQGKERSGGEEGEIWLYGVTVANGYWQKEEATKESFEDGWYKTGDVGYVDEDGYLFVVDRIKDMVIRGGENISSLEVERAIDNHPEVLEAAVFGLPHDTLGEIVAAEVSLKKADALSAEEIQSHVSDQLAHYKVPERVFVSTDPLPRNPTGKVLKKSLQKLRA